MVDPESLKSGVVTVTVGTILTDQELPAQGGINFDTDATTVTRTCNAIYLRGGKLLVPASAVLLPPTYQINLNKYSGPDQVAQAPNGTMPNIVSSGSQVLVTFNFERLIGKGSDECKSKSYSYRAHVVSADPLVNLALIKVSFIDPYNDNENNPSIGHLGCEDPCGDLTGLVHAFEWACSEPVVGDDLFIIGSSSNFMFATGVASQVHATKARLLHANYSEESGNVQGDCMVLEGSSQFYPNSGAAVVNKEGKLVGMLLGAPSGSSFSRAIIAQFLQDPPTGQGQQFFPQGVLPHSAATLGCGMLFSSTLRGTQTFVDYLKLEDGRLVSNKIGQLEEQNTSDQFGVLYRACLGIAYRLMFGADYTGNVDWTGGVTGEASSFYPILNAGELVPGPPSKPVRGILVTALAGESNNAFLVPGTPEQSTNGFPPSIPNSPLIGTGITFGDLITAIYVGGENGVRFELGNHERGHSLAYIMGLVPVGGKVVVEYYKGDNPLSKFSVKQLTAEIEPIALPPFLNFPYSHADSYPEISNPAPGFSSPLLGGLANFKPSS